MAIKLYPPLIEGTIPAFSKQENGTVILTVPFSLNRAVAKSEIAGFIVKIKTVQGGMVLGTFSQLEERYYDLDTNFTVKFDITSIANVLNIGQYYKIQLAFLNGSLTNPTVGYYSTVGVVKYTTHPKIAIQKLDSKKLNSHSYTYTVSYSQLNGDSTEKLYSTRFRLYNNRNKVIIDSGDILHNSNNDNSSYEACESYTIAQDLEENELYYLIVTMTTSNGLEASSPKYKIIQIISNPSEIKGKVVAKNNFEDGYIRVSLVGDKNDSGLEASLIGHFCISRAASNENYTWREIFSFSSIDSYTSRILWDDYTVEQGVQYKYSIQQFNMNDIYSERIVSNVETADFEDAFLFDGTRQLKIRYNPKIASFKTDILESKMDTIGSKHPFIFRNGNVYYKEFPISGLISYKMDDNEKFLTKEELGLISQNSYKATLNRTQFIDSDMSMPELTTNLQKLETYNLESYNIFAERVFKIAVLDWLNNGETKLFRSPSEGNYIVRLLNNSLSPTDQLGRMLHTFNSTAFEVQDFSYESLLNLALLTNQDISTITAKWKTVELAGHSAELDSVIENLENYIKAGVCSVITAETYSRIINAIPNAKLYLHPYNKGYVIGTELAAGEFYPLRDTVPEELEFKQALLQLKETNAITYATDHLNSGLIYSIDVKDMLPGMILAVTFLDQDDVEYIQIGATGAYKAKFDNPAVSIDVVVEKKIDGTLMSTTGIQGSITYSYNDTTDTLFSLIESYVIENSPCKQFIGTPTPKTLYKFEEDGVHEITTTNLLDFLQDTKTLLTNINRIKFIARPQLDIFMDDTFDITELSYPNNYNPNDETEFAYDGKYYFDMSCLEEIDLNSLNPYYVYAICHKPSKNFQYQSVGYDGYYLYSNYNHGYYVYNNVKYPIFTGYYLIKPQTKDSQPIIFNTNNYQHNIELVYNTSKEDDKDILNILEQKELILDNFAKVDDLKSINIDQGVICEISYQAKENVFSLEAEDKLADSKKKLWELAVKKWEKYNAAMVAIGNLQYARLTTYSNDSDNPNFLNLQMEQQQIVQEACRYDEVFNDIITQNYLGNYSLSKENEEQLVVHEQELLDDIHTAYDEFLYSLQSALYNYERGSGR